MNPARDEVQPAVAPLGRSPMFGWRDTWLALGLGLITGGYTAVQAIRHQAMFIRWPAYNFWFDGDSPLIAQVMTDGGLKSGFTHHHPLFLLATHGPRWLLGTLTGLWDFESVMLLTVAGAASMTAATYVLLRGLDLSRGESVVFTALMAVSAAPMFWFPVPEFAVFGAVTIIAVFAASAWWERGARIPTVAMFAIATSTLVFTVTNLSAGGLALLARYRLRKAIVMTIGCLAVTVVLAAIQMRLFDSAQLFFLPDGQEGSYMFHPHAGGPLAVARSLAVHTVVMPEFEVATRAVRWAGHLSAQLTPLGTGGPVVLMGEVLWLSLLLMGMVWLATRGRSSRTIVAMTCFIAVQYVLHIAYGVETFLYALHWTTPLIAIAALSVRHDGRVGRGLLVAAAAATLVIGANNQAAFSRAISLLAENETRYAPKK